MGWLSKLIVVNNLGCPKYKRNSAEFLKKKNSPSNKEDMLGSFNIDRVAQSDCYIECIRDSDIFYLCNQTSCPMSETSYDF